MQIRFGQITQKEMKGCFVNAQGTYSELGKATMVAHNLDEDGFKVNFKTPRVDFSLMIPSDDGKPTFKTGSFSEQERVQAISPELKDEFIKDSRELLDFYQSRQSDRIPHELEGVKGLEDQ